MEINGVVRLSGTVSPSSAFRRAMHPAFYGSFIHHFDFLVCGRPPDPSERLNESGRYRYRFDVPSEWKGREIRIVFGGVATDASVRINGRSAGEKHQGGIYRPVWLEARPKVNIDRIAVDARADGHLRVDVFPGGKTDGAVSVRR